MLTRNDLKKLIDMVRQEDDTSRGARAQLAKVVGDVTVNINLRRKANKGLNELDRQHNEHSRLLAKLQAMQASA